MKKLSFLAGFLLLSGFEIELLGSERLIKIPENCSLIRKYHGEKSEKETPNNLIYPYGSGQALVFALSGSSMIVSRYGTEVSYCNIKLENTTISLCNLLRCAQHVNFVDLSQIEGMDS